MDTQQKKIPTLEQLQEGGSTDFICDRVSAAAEQVLYDAVSAVPVSHDAVSAVPVSHDAVSVEPVSHDAVSVEPVSHDVVSAEPDDVRSIRHRLQQ